MKNLGHASIFIELKDNTITVDHRTDKATLAKWKAKDGDWDYIWQVINILQSGNDLEIKEF